MFIIIFPHSYAMVRSIKKYFIHGFIVLVGLLSTILFFLMPLLKYEYQITNNFARLLPEQYLTQSMTIRHNKSQLYTVQGHLLGKPPFVSGDLPYFYLYGAAMLNTTGRGAWSVVHLYGQWHKNYSSAYHEDVKCCFKYDSGYITKSDYMRHRSPTPTVDIGTFKYVCLLPDKKATGLPCEVGLAYGHWDCNSPGVPYVQPFYPKMEPGKLGISPKVCYGSISSESIIEWLETMKYLGVDKILIYADESLNKDALVTLQHYESTGFINIFPYHQPGKDVCPRDPSEKTNQKYRDNRLLIEDAVYRLGGYTYFGIIDMDEFLIPSQKRTLKQLMKYSEKKYPKSAGLYFKTKFFIKSWGKVNESSDLEIGQYLNTTKKPPEFEKRKAIVKLNRIQSYLSTHVIQEEGKYKVHNCPQGLAYIRHYRNCRPGWDKCDALGRETSYEMINWVNTHVATNIRESRRLIFNTTNR